MYPNRELIRLEAHKAALRRDIAFRRAEVAVAAGRLIKPLEWIDRGLAWWRNVSPLAKFAAVPIGAMMTRMIFRRMGKVGMLLRWAPLLINVFKGFKAGSRA